MHKSKGTKSIGILPHGPLIIQFYIVDIPGDVRNNNTIRAQIDPEPFHIHPQILHNTYPWKVEPNQPFALLDEDFDASE